MTPFKTESWLWYGIVMVMVLLRFFSRFYHFKSNVRLHIEDYLMIFITCAYTVFIVLINICLFTQTNLIDPNDIPNLTPEDIATRTYGSKIVLGVEQTMCMVQWGTKACLLFLYYRLTENLVQTLFVRGVGVYIALTFIVMEILYLGYWCRPFSDYWKTPTDNVQCTTAMNHLIVNLSFNLTSDILVMSIPLPLLLRAHLEIKRKVLICFPFTLGFFSIICAILSKHVSFTHPFSPDWVFWYTREASCVMIVANMPYTWGLARRVFKLKSFWGQGNSETDIDGIDIEETYTNEAGSTNNSQLQNYYVQGEKGSASAGWKQLSGIFTADKQINKPPPVITIDSKDVSEEISPATSSSDTSPVVEPWQDVDWDKSGTDVHIVQVSARNSPVSPHCLAPPSAATVQSGARRANIADLQKTSSAESRRTNMFSSRRNQRPSVSETSRRKPRNNSVNVDAVDRLYRLDDDDLVADLEAARPRSNRTKEPDHGPDLSSQCGCRGRSILSYSADLPKNGLRPKFFESTLHAALSSMGLESQGIFLLTYVYLGNVPLLVAAAGGFAIEDLSAVYHLATELEVTSPFDPSIARTNLRLSGERRHSGEAVSREEHNEPSLFEENTQLTTTTTTPQLEHIKHAVSTESILNNPPPAIVAHKKSARRTNQQKRLPSTTIDSFASQSVMNPARLFIASLGNPPPYSTTRHSAGHIVLKSLQSYLQLPPFQKSRAFANGLTSLGAESGYSQYTLWQSPSLMNVSGVALLKAYQTFASSVQNTPTDPLPGLVILYDEMETTPSQLRLRRGTSSARGHNGLKSVQQSLQSAGLTSKLGDRFVKVGIGIGRPAGGTRSSDDVSQYVLGQFTGKEKQALDGKIEELVRMLEGEMVRMSK